jgi:cob(I)alamin adenosyltransferase
MIHLYTGDGKGKTTAAVGQAVRACGNGYKVVFAQFMKGNETGEINALSEMSGIEILRSSEDFGFFSSMDDEAQRKLTRIHNDILDRLLESAEKKEAFMIILDELTYPVKWGLVDVYKVKRLLKAASGVCTDAPELVITGRDAADFIYEAADYITEMKAVRHPFKSGTVARRGIEY